MATGGASKSEDEMLLATLNKASTENLKKEMINKSGFDVEEIEKMDKKEIVARLFKVRKEAGNRTSLPSRQLPEKPDIMSETMKMMQLQWMRDDRQRALENEERIEQEERAERRKLIKKAEKKEEEEKQRAEKKEEEEKQRAEKKEDEERRHQEQMDMLYAQTKLHQDELEHKKRVLEEEKAARMQKENKREVRLKKAKDLMKDILTYMPKTPSEMPAYFTTTSKILDENDIDDDIRLSVVNMYLIDDARKLLTNRVDYTQLSFKEAVEIILRTYKLSAGKYKDMFYKLNKIPSDTFSQYSAKLSVQLQYYLSSRKIDNNFDKLFKLLVADKFKESLSFYYREKVRVFESGEWKAPEDVADMLDVLVGESDDFRQNSNNQYNKTGMGGSVQRGSGGAVGSGACSDSWKKPPVVDNVHKQGNTYLTGNRNMNTGH